MTPTEKINFRVARDVGQVYNTTFRFIRQNKAILLKSITYYIMPFILVAAFLIFNGIGDLVGLAVAGSMDGNWLVFGLSIMQGIFGLIIGYLAYATYITMIYEYMKLYHETEDPDIITHQMVWKATRKRFFIGFANVLVWGILVSALTGAIFVIFYIFIFIGALLSMAFNSPIFLVIFYGCLYLTEYFLLFYIQVATFPMIFISSMERVDIFTAFGRSFSMVSKKRNFWNAMGAAFVGMLILLILRYNVLGVPIGIITAIISTNTADISTLAPGTIWFNLIFKVIAPLFTLLYFYCFIIYFIGEAFETLSLDERVNAKGLLAKIDKLGTNKDSGPEFYEAVY